MLERFVKNVRLTYAECDCCAQMRPSAVMRQIQETASEHLEALSLPRRLLWDDGFVFLLTRVHLLVERMPCAEDTVCIATQAYQPKGAQFFRDVLFETPSGERMLTARSAWVLANPQGHKIRRPAELPYHLPIVQADYDYSWARAHITAPAEQAGEETTRAVRFSDIDVNRHMNNAVYADIVADCLPQELHENWRLRSYLVSFIGEAQLGAVLHVSAAQTGGGMWYVGAQKQDGTRCFETETCWDRK